MAFVPDGEVLLAYNSAGSPAVDQDIDWSVSCPVNDPAGVTFRLAADLAQTGGATSPTLVLQVLGSANGTNWVQLQRLDTNGTDASVAGTEQIDLPRFVRVRLVAAGGTKPAAVANVQIYASAGVTFTPIA